VKTIVAAAELLSNGTFDWALMLVGFAGLGVMLRTSRRLVPVRA
jgi:hypothetical protein